MADFAYSPMFPTTADSTEYELVSSDHVRLVEMAGETFDLRAKAEKELGDKFDIRGFHDVVLGDGALPLSLLERRVDAWIDEQQTS